MKSQYGHNPRSDFGGRYEFHVLKIYIAMVKTLFLVFSDGEAMLVCLLSSVTQVWVRSCMVLEGELFHCCCLSRRARIQDIGNDFGAPQSGSWCVCFAEFFMSDDDARAVTGTRRVDDGGHDGESRNVLQNNGRTRASQDHPHYGLDNP